ncbi:cytosolic phospholipase A2-like [Haliotis cracherodii]|uniref:cytosolic phospholipase A2-like n=1 Tax=Haliotis cracherodii TaxID=6455 RepID=UPI0039ECB432
MSFKSNRFDPFKVFEVHHKPCTILVIQVNQGFNITKGWAKDLVDTPDPYVVLSIKTSPSGWQKTTVKDNNVNPVWNETFTFFLDPSLENELEISLMDANYMVDEHLCTKHLPLKPLPLDKTIRHRIRFNDTSEVEIQMEASVDYDPKLNYSLALCDEEKQFMETRKRRIFDSMRDKLKENGPRNLREVPTIAVLGSGGGFRAMSAMCGVMGALVDSKVLDMVSYVAGLSGSAWYISQLYSHPDWPRKTPNQMKEELKENIQSSPFWLLNPQSMYRYIRRIMEKRQHGQPVSFTDFFGHLVGETLLKGRLDTRLTDQQQRLQSGEIPMPLYTCLHVKKHVSAMIFHEWMEFSPYEIGMPKYATFMQPQLFGSKFFMGQLVKQYPEPPLHFLQGIWGSAFCIQFKRLLQDDKQVDAVELMRREREELEKELQQDIDDQSDEDSDTSDPEAEMDPPAKSNTKTNKKPLRKPSLRKTKSGEKSQKSFWSGMLESLFDSALFQSIEGRAAMVHNFMRGLSLSNVYPYSPFDASTAEHSKDQFDGIFEMYPTHIKKLYVVDGGLTFNSPFPPMLRPQRGVDLLLSFDFSARPSDTTPPFKELLLAEKWARLNQVPFPPIDPSVVDREGLKECYLFKDPKDPHCPVVLHFCLVNITFRDEKMPGIPRETEEEKDFADFDLFDDPERPYSTFNFKYTNKSFDRLTKLTEFNTLMYKDLILEQVKHCIKVRRRHSIRRPIKLKDIKKLGLKDKHKVEKLEAFIRSLDQEEPPIC